MHRTSSKGAEELLDCDEQSESRKGLGSGARAKRAWEGSLVIWGMRYINCRFAPVILRSSLCLTSTSTSLSTLVAGDGNDILHDIKSLFTSDCESYDILKDGKEDDMLF